MRLCNLHIINGKSGTRDICVEQGRVVASNTTERDTIFFENAIAFQGLINAHDHLEFNLFPQLKSHTYLDYKEWGIDIHSQFRAEIDHVLRVPVDLRTKWGVLKNLLNGITTVVDHGRNQVTQNLEVDVYNAYNYIHSVGLEQYWRIKLNNPLNRLPVITHIGEGTNRAAEREVSRLIRWNLMRKRLIGVHGIGMDVSQAHHFHALVWCPASNYFLYNATAPVDHFKKHTSILFGTDSALSASANLWEHLRLARDTNLLSDEELFESLTSTPSSLFEMEKGLHEGCQADIVIADKRRRSDLDAFYCLNPEDILLIIKDGQIIYFDGRMEDQVSVITQTQGKFGQIFLNDKEKHIRKEAVDLLKKLKAYDLKLPLPVVLK